METNQKTDLQLPAEKPGPPSKADAFSRHLRDRGIAFFSKTPANDAMQTVVFSSNLRIGDDILPCSIVFDKSIYVTLRIRVLAGSVDCDNHYEMLNYVNATNTRYKLFKYMVAANGDLVLDACMTFLPDSFSPALVLQMLDTIHDHLIETHPLWQQRSKRQDAPLLQ